MRFLFCLPLLALAMPALAQADQARNLATDTLQPANATYRLPVSRVRTLGGQTLYVFLRESSNGQTSTLEFTWRHPLTLPRPKPVTIKLSQVAWVATQGNYYEPIRLLGAEAQLLARRRVAGPRLELFEVANPKTKAASLLPVAGVAVELLARRDSSDYTYAWLLRRVGQHYMALVPAKKKFAPFLATYLAPSPALADSVRRQAPGYGYDDVPRIVRAYNHRP